MFTRSVRVMPSDVSCDGRIKLRSLLNYFQDTAGLAVEDIEGTSTELYSRGYAWVLMKYEIDFAGKLPMLDDTFTIHTFHDPNHGYNTLRMFQVYNGQQENIVSAKTSWLLVDVHTGRPVKPTAHIPGIASRDNQDISPDFTDIPDIDTVTRSANITVKYHDLDYNGHVNNAVYFEWVYDLSPVDIMTHSLRRICALFRSGARQRECVTVDFSVRENMCVSRVYRPNSTKPCASFLCVWSVNHE
ncbi:MAG: hypothetical protein IJR63_07645 [Synergistaceae bacterium]|nr:hypothetical protein [Synergistaceae bacterium]